ncbi:MAG TPA: cation diffusion facilitator family transporter [Halanaerobiales bacterium]|nr:cation diffusion facilitator family transporter [Halanaerobiales bacterium]
MDRYSQGKKISYITIFGNIFLALLKIIIGTLVASSALIADGFHSVSDVASTLAVLIAIYVSSKPPDEEHQYGHGQAESIAAKILGILLLLTGLVLGYNIIKQIINQNFGIPGIYGLWAAIASIIIKEIMFRYTYKVGQKTNNQALIADAWHHRSDAISSVAAAIGILGANMGLPILDPIAGIIVAILIIRVGWNIIVDAVNALMVKAPPKEDSEEIRETVNKIAGVKDIKELRAHYSGVDLYVDLRIVVDGNLTVKEGHDISVDVRNRLLKECEQVKEVIVHIHPG